MGPSQASSPSPPVCGPTPLPPPQQMRASHDLGLMFLEQVEAAVSLGAVQVRNACSSVVSVVRLAPFDGYITTTTAAAPAPALQLLLGCSSQKILDQKRYFCLLLRASLCCAWPPIKIFISLIPPT